MSAMRGGVPENLAVCVQLLPIVLRHLTMVFGYGPANGRQPIHRPGAYPPLVGPAGAAGGPLDQPVRVEFFERSTGRIGRVAELFGDPASDLRLPRCPQPLEDSSPDSRHRVQG